jgi:hypothetical protein
MRSKQAAKVTGTGNIDYKSLKELAGFNQARFDILCEQLKYLQREKNQALDEKQFKEKLL